jgi:hypothetical protein
MQFETQRQGIRESLFQINKKLVILPLFRYIMLQQAPTDSLANNGWAFAFKLYG